MYEIKCNKTLTKHETKTTLLQNKVKINHNHKLSLRKLKRSI